MIKTKLILATKNTRAVLHVKFHRDCRKVGTVGGRARVTKSEGCAPRTMNRRDQGRTQEGADGAKEDLIPF